MADHTPDIIEERQLQAWQSFLAATDRLIGAIASGNLAEAHSQLRQREELIQVINRLNRQIDRCGKRHSTRVSERIREILKQIDTANATCTDISAKQHDGLKKTMKALRGYGRPNAKAGRPKVFSIQT